MSAPTIIRAPGFGRRPLAEVVRDALAGLRPFVVGAMAPGRELGLAGDAVIAGTERYLRACIQLAHDVGAPAVCGPFYAYTGRLWRMDAAERADACAQLRRNLAPPAAEAAGVVLGIEPLNRYETSLINTTAQALDAIRRPLAETQNQLAEHGLAFRRSAGTRSP